MRLINKIGALSLIGFVFILTPLSIVGAASLSIGSISPGTTILPGNEVSFQVISSGFSSTVNYSVTDSINNTSISSNNFNNSGVFTWIPGSADSGVHNLTVTATDQVGNSSSANVQITVQGPPTVSINSLSPGSTVVIGQTVYFTATGSNFVNPTFSVYDSNSNSSVLSTSIQTSGINGYFTWSPLSQDVGQHTINVSATDALGDNSSVTQVITVNPANSLNLQSINPGLTVGINQPLTFTVLPTGAGINGSYNISDSFYGTSLSNSNINSSGNFAWTPTSTDLGTHVVTISGIDTIGRQVSTTTTLYIGGQTSSVSISSPYPSSVISAGQNVKFSVNTSGFNSPAYTMSDSFSGSSLSSSNIDLYGNFSWNPTSNDVGIHNITLTAVDTQGHNASYQTEITVLGTGTTSSVPTSALHYFGRNLSFGENDSEVLALQNYLINSGYLAATPNGHFGPATELAVKKFQTAHGLPAVGIVGPSTRQVINSGSSSTTSQGNVYTFNLFLNEGTTGSEVSALQKKLTTLGFYSGPITGKFGTLTKSAVMKFQSSNSLPVVGYVGPATRNALNKN